MIFIPKYSILFIIKMKFLLTDGTKKGITPDYQKKTQAN